MKLTVRLTMAEADKKWTATVVAEDVTFTPDRDAAAFIANVATAAAMALHSVPVAPAGVQVPPDSEAAT